MCYFLSGGVKWWKSFSVPAHSEEYQCWIKTRVVVSVWAVELTPVDNNAYVPVSN